MMDHWTRKRQPLVGSTCAKKCGARVRRKLSKWSVVLTHQPTDCAPATSVYHADMTAYFDAFRSKIHDVALDAPNAMEQLHALNEQCIRDVSICAEWPGLPGWAREAIHEAVVTFSWAACGELVGDGCTDQGPDDASEYAARLREMENNLHTIFHGIGSWAHENTTGIWVHSHHEQMPFSDDPRRPMDEHLGNAQEARLQAARKLGKCPSREDLRAKRIAKGWDETEA